MQEAVTPILEPASSPSVGGSNDYHEKLDILRNRLEMKMVNCYLDASKS